MQAPPLCSVLLYQVPTPPTKKQSQPQTPNFIHLPHDLTHLQASSGSRRRTQSGTSCACATMQVAAGLHFHNAEPLMNIAEPLTNTAAGACALLRALPLRCSASAPPPPRAHCLSFPPPPPHPHSPIHTHQRHDAMRPKRRARPPLCAAAAARSRLRLRLSRRCRHDRHACPDAERRRRRRWQHCSFIHFISFFVFPL